MQEFYQLLNDKTYRDFIRLNPVWYKNFNRAHDTHIHFKNAVEAAKKNATPSKLVTIDKHLNTANLMLKLIKGFK